jgi:predicted  nucleic acid-binding Zn-ribbon protein
MLMANAKTRQESTNKEKHGKDKQPEENINRQTNESEVKNEQSRQEEVGTPLPESHVAEGDSLQGYRDQLKQRLDEELTNLEATQEKASNRLKTESESGTIESSDFDILNLADISQERADILSIVKSLERQAGTSSKLKDVLEGDIESLQKKLSKETETRIQLEEKLASLETSSDKVAQLREDNVSLKKERDRLTSLLEEIRPHLEAVTEGRDSLSEEMAYAQKRTRELASRNADLETQIKRLQERIAETERLRAELNKVTDERQVSAEQVRRLMDRLEEANKVRDTLESDLAASHEAMCNMRKEMESLQDEVTNDGSQVSNLRNQLIAQSAELAAANEKVQQEVAARRQTEEMLREIKTRLLSLSQNKTVAAALGLSRA